MIKSVFLKRGFWGVVSLKGGWVAVSPIPGFHTHRYILGTMAVNWGDTGSTPCSDTGNDGGRHAGNEENNMENTGKLSTRSEVSMSMIITIYLRLLQQHFSNKDEDLRRHGILVRQLV